MKRAHRGPESGAGFSVSSLDARRFWQGVAVGKSPVECWQWQRSRNVGGYGQFHIPAVRKGPLPAHRVAYAIKNGYVPSGALVMHSCDNPRCVNPDHLILGSVSDNTRDSISKGRFGVRNFVGREKCSLCGAPRGAGVGLCRSCGKCRRRWELEQATRQNREAIRYRLPAIPPSWEDTVALSGERRATVYAMYYGLWDCEPMILEEIAAHFGITRQRTQQIVARVAKLIQQRQVEAREVLGEAA